MTQDEIIRMAREANIPCFAGMYIVTEPSELERFAALIAAHEREACAKVCDELVKTDGFHQAEYCAAAIRARSQIRGEK